MSHAIYQTSAFILKTKNTKEANKLVFLYTEKFGLIYANIQSVRKEKSKMRYHLHPYALVNLDIVAGRNIWHITGIEEKKSPFSFSESSFYGLVSLIGENLIRLCPGEEENSLLWNNINLFINNIDKKNEPFLKEYEIITLVKILHSLGYWHHKDFILEKKNPYEKSTFLKVKENIRFYVEKINQSLSDSQL